MNTRVVLSTLSGMAGACVLFFGLNHFSDYASTWWRNRGTEDPRSIWVLLGSVLVGLALMYPAARLLSARKR